MDLIPSGITLVNLACTGDPSGFVQEGILTRIVGDSDTGKSFLGRTILAECFYKYGDAKFYIHDDIEHGIFYDDAKMFGKAFADKALEPPFDYSDGKSTEQFYRHFHNCVLKSRKEKRPFIYVLDSYTGLRPEVDLTFIKSIVDDKDKKSFGMAQAKMSSLLMQQIVEELAETNSNLFLIQQTRDNIDPMSFDKKTVSGGSAVRFQSSLEVWLSSAGQIKVDADLHPVGVQVKFLQRRSRLVGARCTVTFPINYVYGIDNTQANIDFLLEQGVIKKEGHSLAYEPWDIKVATRKFAAEIEKQGKQKDLDALVATTWREIETSIVDKILQGRSPKYGN
jgi:RecA/RadA recombinase